MHIYKALPPAYGNVLLQVFSVKIVNAFLSHSHDLVSA